MPPPKSYARDMRVLLLGLLLVAMPAQALGPVQFGRAYQRVEPAVVVVEAPHAKGVRRGGGFVASPDGLVVCASQTVERTTSQRVLIDGTWFPATLVAMDSKLRVALLQVTAPALLKAVAVAAKPVLRPDQWLVAVERQPSGKARGMAGMVSVRAPGAKEDAVVLVDASAVAGSPLVNMEGEVVGMSLGRISPRRGRAMSLQPMQRFLRQAAAARPAP